MFLKNNVNQSKMKVFKKISIVYTLQILVIIVLFYPGAAQETALSGDTAIKKQNESVEINPNYFPIAADPAFFFEPVSNVKEFYFLSSLDK